MTNMKSYLVVWTPKSYGNLVNEMKLIDAFSASSLMQAKRHVEENRYEYGKYGPGHVELLLHTFNTMHVADTRTEAELEKSNG